MPPPKMTRPKGQGKRKRDFDPTASDSNDEDYNGEEMTVTRAARKTTKATPRGKKLSKPAKPLHRKRNLYHSEEDEDDPEEEDGVSEISIEEGQAESEEELPVNRAGRSTRRAATKVQTYQESDPEDGKDDEEEGEEEPVNMAAQGNSKIIKLKLSNAETKITGPSGQWPTDTPVTPSFQRRTTRASSKEPTSVPRPPSSAGRSTRAPSVGALTRPIRSTKHSSVVSAKVRQGSVDLINPLSRRSSRLHPELESENTTHLDFSKPLPKHPSTVQEEEEENFEFVNFPKPDEILKPVIDTSIEAVYGGSLDTLEGGEVDQDVLRAAYGAGGAAYQNTVAAPPYSDAESSDVDLDNEDDEDDELPRQPSRRSKSTAQIIQNQPSTPPPKSSPTKDIVPYTISPVKSRKSPMKTQHPQNTLELPRQSRRGGSRGGSQTRGSDDDDWKMDEDGSDDSEDMSGSGGSRGKPAKPFVVVDDVEDYSETGRRARGKGSQGGGVSKRKRNTTSEDDDIHEELADLQDSPGTRRSKRRAAAKEDLLPRKPQLRERTAKVDYRIINPEFQVFGDDILQTPIVEDGGFGGGRKPVSAPPLYGTSGPFGGWGSATPIFGKNPFMGPSADSDSSGDEEIQRRRAGGGSATTARNTAGGTQPNLLPPTAVVNPTLGVADTTTLPPNFGVSSTGQSSSKKVAADSEPLGVDQSVSFDSVGGHEEHIRQLREMVALPLMYPEIFQEFGISPPKGVLFHGPPGTGKTLMARALASSCSTQTGKKITFYMRKGADCLSKWVGEAERQLRLLFEEAKNAQPSIIFFDEIDGLAPVRSAKQDQIHSSIVSTLLALMDGMDGRGQVIVIGATNRPDSVDPALRRPGRFDREFYFPLPDAEARLQIIDIHTKNWTPPLSAAFKKELAVQTKGFGGADIRGMCTEAALNAVQRVYPQLYTSWDKYLINTKRIQVVAADFLKAMKKIVPSSKRSTSSGSEPLPKHIAPLLESPLNDIKSVLRKLLPERKRLTVLEEAMYEDDPDPSKGFEREEMMTDFENARVFRPRLLIHGQAGMGQQYLGGALLHHFEKFHVQLFDMATLQSDPLRSPEAAVIQSFVEVKRHKPSVIFIPNIDTWYITMGLQVIHTFVGLLRSLPPSDPIMLVATAESPIANLDPKMLNDFFGFSKINRYELKLSNKTTRKAYFQPLASHLKKSPRDYPDPTNRPKRQLETLEKAPSPPPRQPTQEEIAAQAKRDGQIRNWLRIGLIGWIEQSKQRYKKLKKPIIDHQLLINLGKEPEPPATEDVASDIPVPVQKLYDITADKHGHPMVLEVETVKKYYNIDVDIIEIRISNGYYCLPRQFLDDIKLIAIDAQTLGSDKERILRANEMVANAEVFVTDLETKDPNWLADCERLYQRQLEKQRAKEARRSAREARKAAETTAAIVAEVSTSIVSSNGVSNGSPQKLGSATKIASPTKVGSPEKVGSPTKIGSPTNTSHPSGIADLLNPQALDVSSSNSTSLTNGVSHDPPVHHSHQSHTETQHMEIGNTGSGSSNESHSTSAFHTAPPSHPTYSHVSQVSSAAGTAKMNIVTMLGDGSVDASRVSSISYRTSGGASAFTQSTNGRSSIGSTQGATTPSFHEFDGISSGDSQLPDTQVLSSSEGSGGQASQAYPMHGSQPLQSQLDSYPQLGEFKTPDAKQIIIDHDAVDDLPDDITRRTSGFTVEQLEQVNSALMETIWAGRNEWNRNKVLERVKDSLREVLDDIGTMQQILPGSFPRVAAFGDFHGD